MEKEYKKLILLTGIFFVSLGLANFAFAKAPHRSPSSSTSSQASQPPAPRQPKVIYQQKTKLDFEGAEIEGELKNPGEFYFQHRPEEKFDSLVKRRKNFHREMLRDVVLSK